MSSAQYQTFSGYAASACNSALILCSNVSTGGGWYTNLDICPNFTVMFDAQVPDWANNSFEFRVISDYQTFKYRWPASNVMQLQDANNFPLQAWALSNPLSNAQWNSFRLVNTDSNLVMAVNGYGYVGYVPQSATALSSWSNGAFAFYSSNGPATLGSNAIRRFFAQSTCTFTDPVTFKNSVIASKINSQKIGSASVRAADMTCIKTFYGSNVYSSNLYPSSNSNNVIGYDATADGPKVLGNSGGYLGTQTQRALTWNSSGYVGIQTGSPAYQLDVTGNSRVTGTMNAGTVNSTYLNASALQFPNTLTNNKLNLWGTDYCLGIQPAVLRYQTGNGAIHSFVNVAGTEYARFSATGLGVLNSNPTYTLDVTGTGRISSGLYCSNISACNLGTAAFLSTIPYSMISGAPGTTSNYPSLTASELTVNSLTAANVTCGNISASNLGSAAFLSTIPYSMISGTPGLTSNYDGLTTTGLTCGSITTSNITVVTSSGNIAAGTNTTYPLDVGTTMRCQKLLHFNDQVQNCLICLYKGALPTSTNTDFYGFGINNGALRYNVYNSSANHVFYAGANELMRISGTGKVSIGAGPDPNWALKVAGDALVTGGVTTVQVTCTSNVTSASVARYVNLLQYTTGYPYYPQIHFNSDSSTKDVHAGKLTYGQFTGQECLEVVGGGTTAGLRQTKIWDKLSVCSTTTLCPSDSVFYTEGNVTANSCSSFAMTSPMAGGSNTTTLKINSVGVLSSTGVVQFVNNGHYVACTDTTNYNSIPTIGTGHNMYYQSGGHNFKGAISAGDGIRVGSDGTKVTKQKIVSLFIPAGQDGTNLFDITHNLGVTNYTVFYSQEDINVNVIDDTFTIKTVAKNANTCTVNIVRRSGTYWNRTWVLVALFMVY